MPLNLRRERIILEKFHLLLPADRERSLPRLQELIGHVAWCRAMVAKWKQQKDNPNFAGEDLYSPVEFPRAPEKPLGESVALLQREQAELLAALPPKATGLTTLARANPPRV